MLAEVQSFLCDAKHRARAAPELTGLLDYAQTYYSMQPCTQEVQTSVTSPKNFGLA